MSKTGLDKDSGKFLATLKLIAEKLGNLHYAFRGTTGLILQGLTMNVDDIDIVCDKTTALAANDLLKDYLTDKIKYGGSSKYKSYFGKFTINGIKIEIYGDWQILDTKRNWSEPFDASDRIEVEFKGTHFYVVPVNTELRIL